MEERGSVLEVEIFISSWRSLLLFFCMACGMWGGVPPPGTERVPPASGAWNLNHWASRKVPMKICRAMRKLCTHSGHRFTSHFPVCSLKDKAELEWSSGKCTGMFGQLPYVFTRSCGLVWTSELGCRHQVVRLICPPKRLYRHGKGQSVRDMWSWAALGQGAIRLPVKVLPPGRVRILTSSMEEMPWQGAKVIHKIFTKIIFLNLTW